MTGLLFGGFSVGTATAMQEFLLFASEPFKSQDYVLRAEAAVRY